MEFLDGQGFEALVYSLVDGRNRFGICSGAGTASSAPDPFHETEAWVSRLRLALMKSTLFEEKGPSQPKRQASTPIPIPIQKGAPPMLHFV